MASDTTVDTATRPGWQTTEFWASLLPTVFLILDRIGITHIPTENYGNIAAQVAAIVSGVFYIWSRTTVKAAVAVPPTTPVK